MKRTMELLNEAIAMAKADRQSAILETLVMARKEATTPPQQHQGSLHDQLVELRQLANQNGLYDAADFLERHLERHLERKR